MCIRDRCNELQTLTQYIWYRSVVRSIVIGIQGQHTAGKGVHHVRARRVHNNSAHNARWQSTVVCKQFLKMFELFMVRQVAEQQEIGGLFKAKPFFADKPPYNLFNVYAALIQFAFAGNLFAVYNFVGNNIGNFSQTGQYAVAV